MREDIIKIRDELRALLYQYEQKIPTTMVLDSFFNDIRVIFDTYGLKEVKFKLEISEDRTKIDVVPCDLLSELVIMGLFDMMKIFSFTV